MTTIHSAVENLEELENTKLKADSHTLHSILLKKCLMLMAHGMLVILAIIFHRFTIVKHLLVVLFVAPIRVYNYNNYTEMNRQKNLLVLLFVVPI